MDFQRFGIDPRLARAAEGLPTNFFFYEKMLAHVVEDQENVCVKIALDNGREEVLLLPALQWILAEAGRKLLIVVPDAEDGDRCASAIERLGSGAGLEVCRVERDEGAEEPIRFTGDPGSAVLLGKIEDLLAAPNLTLRDYGFLVVDGLDRLADLPSEAIRKFSGLLLPSWERRSVLACARFSVKAKNLAWDLADNPSEISIEGEVAKAQSVLKETWSVPVDSKLKFLLGLLSREKPSRLCVFCNLKDTAAEVSRRLAANGIATDSIIGPLLPERKFALIEKFRAGDSTCLVLSDEGAEGLSPGVFPLIVNYDIPLEAELFVKRLEMLDRSDPAAKVVSLACDRYIYGLPAVEQYIDAKLDPLPVDESLLSAVDKSEGMGGDRRPRGDSYPRDGRRGQQQRRETHSRDSRPRDPGPRDSYPRDANRSRDVPRDAYPRDAYPREGRSPDIRKSISEATGGALDMTGLPPDSGYPRPSPPNRPSPAKSQGQSRRGQDQRGERAQEPRPQGKKDGRGKESHRGKAAAPRSPEQRQQSPRQAPGRTQSPSSGPGTPGNPYAMPMEERMKLYREKYGRGLGKDKAGGGRGNRQEPKGGESGGQRAGKNGGRRGSPRQAQDGQQGRPKAPQRGEAGQRSSGPAKLPETPRPSQAPQGEAQRKPEAVRRPEGVVGRLLGALRKKRG
jgi:ATP-dependent RNA helicase RhlB